MSSMANGGINIWSGGGIMDMDNASARDDDIWPCPLKLFTPTGWMKYCRGSTRTLFQFAI